MNPALIAQIAGWITLSVSAAEKLIPAVQAAIAFIRNLFSAGLIDAATQDKLMAHVDAVTLAFVKGETPPQWTVEPDPQ